MPAESSRAVFLSYASQDAEAARRVCETLRAVGVEVWFDQSELRGGDAWDAKIRKQIRDCTLFMPVISANTQSRLEGYFRLEWKLAEDRSHLMARGTPFLLPVCIDDTKDWDAIVPDSFTIVQWVRLPGGETTETFCARVLTLLGSGHLSRHSDVAGPIPDAARSAASARPQRGLHRQESYRRWMIPVLFGVVVTATVIWRPWTSDSPRPGAQATADTAASSAKSQTQNHQPKLSGANAKSIGVLPFTNLSPDAENAFFADGMHEELLTALAKIRDLKVISRTSVLAYRDPAMRNLRQIAAELGVAHVLEGSVRRAGNQVRITVQLIDAATDVQRWSDNYTGDLSDVFQLQADISGRIAQALAATLSPEQKAALARKLTTNPAAYDLYLRSRHWRERAGEGWREVSNWEERVVRPLEKAVALDPNFAAAYAELGQVHATLYWWHQLDPTAGRLAKAKATVDAAQRLDPELPASHLAMGAYFYLGLRDYARAEQEFLIALSAMPGDAGVLESLARAQRRLGRWPEATANIERAFAISPRSQDTKGTWIDLLLEQRLYSQAERALERMTAMNSPYTDSATHPWIRFAQDGDRERYLSAFAATSMENNTRQFMHAFWQEQFTVAMRIVDEKPDIIVRSAFVGEDLRRLRYYLYAVAEDGGPQKAGAAVRRLLSESKDRFEVSSKDWERAVRAALLYAYTGQAEEARRLADRLLEAVPPSRDAVDGPRALYEIACLHLVLGDQDRALALLDQAMSVPNLISANEIRLLEPGWKPLQNDKRFKAALAKAAPRD